MPAPIPSLSDIINQFRGAMLNDGIECNDEIIADGVIHRFRVHGDKRGRKNGWYTLHYDQWPTATYGCHKRFPDQQFTWKLSGEQRELTPEELAERQRYAAQKKAEREKAEIERNAKAKVKAAKLWNEAVPCSAHEYLAAKQVKSWGLRVGPWHIWDEDARQYVKITDKALLIPMMDRDRNIHSLQAIIPASDVTDEEDLTKFFLPGGAKREKFYIIGQPQTHNGKTVFILAEGYATAASVHEATGHAVAVCFDVGNLQLVAKLIALKMMERGDPVLIIVAADNDRWTTQPVNNPGVTKGRQTAAELDGLVAVPQFVSLEGRPTDFNDLHVREGIDAVAQVFSNLLNPPAEPEIDYEELEIEEHEADQPFSFLGYTADHFVVYQHEQKLVKFISQNGIMENTLLNLAPLIWWEHLFPKKNGGIDKTAAVNWFNRQANRVGFFDAKRVRGRGAWIDRDRLVVHHGNRLTVGGVAVDLTRIRSNYIYPMGNTMPQLHEQPLTAAEGKELLAISQKIAWTRPGSAPMLVGWGFLAPLGGALKWRPHIWITGGAGSGKSTIQSDFLMPMIQGYCEAVQGSSTEAGIRQQLGSDAIPVVMDESESNDKREKHRVEALLALVRQSSSETQARTLKGTASGQSLHYLIRSMFCLASINTLLTKQADAERLTRLEILPSHMRKNDNWGELEDDFHRVKNWENLSARMVTRALSMWKEIMLTVEVFKRVGGSFFKSQRVADQYGTLMAGCWCLTSDKVATDEEALTMLASYEWDEHISVNEKDDAQKALSKITSCFVGTVAGQMTVYQLIMIVLGKSDRDDPPGFIDKTKARLALRTWGIMVLPEKRRMAFAPNNPNLSQMVADEPYANDLRGQLKRLPGSGNNNNKSLRFDSGPEKVVCIPLSLVVDEEEFAPVT
ncbi:toprim domain-containing protein [Salmonella enterica]|nr:toprim domain-containing protein [Salmonella enterica]